MSLRGVCIRFFVIFGFSRWLLFCRRRGFPEKRNAPIKKELARATTATKERRARALGSHLRADRALEGSGALVEAPAMTDTTLDVVGTFRWAVPGWSRLTEEPLFSRQFDVGGVSWLIELRPRGRRDRNCSYRNSSGYVSMYLLPVHPQPKTLPDNLMKHVSYTLTIEGAKMHDDEDAATVSARDVRLHDGYTFNIGRGQRRGFGVSLTTLNDPNKGLVSRDDTLVITAEVSVVDKTQESVLVNCHDAAGSGSLEVLKYLRSKSAPWDEATCAAAAWSGHLDILKWARENGCPWDRRTCDNAARHGHLGLLKWARENGAPWDEHTCAYALRGKHFEVARYIVDERERALKATDAIPGLFNHVVNQHILKPDQLLSETDLARLRAVSPAMRDAVGATRRVLCFDS